MRENAKLTCWVDMTTGSDSWRTIAEKLHTTHPTIQRRLKNAEADAIIELASVYGVNPIPGLIAAGSVTKTDVLAYAGTYAVEDLSDIELAQIMVNRLEQRERENDEDAAVFEFPGKPVSPVWDGDGMPPDAVADDSEEVGGTPDDLDP